MTIKTLGDITRLHRAKRPDDTAMVYTADGRSWTFKELDDEACQVAQALLDAGVGAGDRVAYLDKNAPEYFTLLYGITKLNAVSVAVNWRLSASEMEYILANSESRVVLIGEEFLPQLREMSLDSAQVVVIGDPGDTGYPSYEQWIANKPAHDPHVPASEDDTCYQLYTSGTTGLPKGVELTHGNFIALLQQGLSILQLSSEAVNLVCMPLFHISGSGWGVVGQFEGAKTILFREVDLDGILRAIPEYQVTHTIFVPAVLQFLLNMPNVRDVDYSSLKAMLYGASPITEAVLVDAINTFKCDFFQAYGLTETTGACALLFPGDHDPGGPRAHLLRSCGKPVGGNKMKVVDTGTLEDAAEGEVGEIWIAGPQVMKGYWRNPDATRDSITDDGWFRSGDLGYVQDGYFFIHDRLKDMIISGGENIYPAEVENILMKHPDVADAAVIGVPDERWGETVKAIVVPGREGLTEEEVFAFCRKELAHYKCPTSVDWIDEIPRNPSGKILKTELRKPYWHNKDRNVS